jgi:hypothetical protein
MIWLISPTLRTHENMEDDLHIGVQGLADCEPPEWTPTFLYQEWEYYLKEWTCMISVNQEIMTARIADLERTVHVPLKCGLGPHEHERQLGDPRIWRGCPAALQEVNCHLSWQ